MLETAPHVLPLRVYWEDTDAGGVVYYANYLRFAERARSDMLRQAGIESRALWEDEGRVFAVRRCEADYLAPARLDDRIEVHSTVDEIGASTMLMRQIVRRDGEDLVVMKVLLACLNEKGCPVRIPSRVRSALATLRPSRERN